MSLRNTMTSAFRTMCRHPRNGLQAFFGLAMGVAALVVALALQAGANEWRHAPAIAGTRLEIFPQAAHAGVLDAAQASTLTEADVAAIRNIDGIALAAGSVLHIGQLSYAGTTGPVSVYAVDADYFAIRDWVLDGAFSAHDFIEANNVAMFGSALGNKVFADTDAAGKTVRIDDVEFRARGVVSARDASTFFGDYALAVFMPMRSARRAFAAGNGFGGNIIRQISILTTATADARVVQQAVSVLLRQRHAISSGRLDDFQVRNFSAFGRASQRVQAWWMRMFADIAMIALLLGGYALAHVMLACVDELATKIGMCIANGAGARAIESQLLAESALVAIAAALLGALLGVAAIFWMASATRRNLHLSFAVVLLAFAAACVIGLLCGFLAARKAVRLDPAALLRNE